MKVDAPALATVDRLRNDLLETAFLLCSMCKLPLLRTFIVIESRESFVGGKLPFEDQSRKTGKPKNPLNRSFSSGDARNLLIFREITRNPERKNVPNGTFYTVICITPVRIFVKILSFSILRFWIQECYDCPNGTT
jgi:hypothetical protein